MLTRIIIKQVCVPVKGHKRIVGTKTFINKGFWIKYIP